MTPQQREFKRYLSEIGYTSPVVPLDVERRAFDAGWVAGVSSKAGKIPKCRDNKRHYWKDGWVCEKCGLRKADLKSKGRKL